MGWDGQPLKTNGRTPLPRSRSPGRAVRPSGSDSACCQSWTRRRQPRISQEPWAIPLPWPLALHPRQGLTTHLYAQLQPARSDEALSASARLQSCARRQSPGEPPCPRSSRSGPGNAIGRNGPLVTHGQARHLCPCQVHRLRRLDSAGDQPKRPRDDLRAPIGIQDELLPARRTPYDDVIRVHRPSIQVPVVSKRRSTVFWVEPLRKPPP